jgi:hypothetical protein
LLGVALTEIYDAGVYKNNAINTPDNQIFDTFTGYAALP